MASYYSAAHNRAGQISDLMTPSRWLPIPLLVQNFERGNETLSVEGTFMGGKNSKTNQAESMTGFQYPLKTHIYCTHIYIWIWELDWCFWEMM